MELFEVAKELVDSKPRHKRHSERRLGAPGHLFFLCVFVMLFLEKKTKGSLTMFSFVLVRDFLGLERVRFEDFSG